MMTKIRTYSELCSYTTFEDRFNYLQLKEQIGEPTFGYDRYLNQIFYTSKEYREFRRSILLRDQGRDLGIEGREIFEYATLHHINPITIEDIELGRDCIIDPENAILTAPLTHKAIHFADISILSILPRARTKGDTCLWPAFSRR